MFRAITNYNSSGSNKRITLRVGDSVSGVHSLDDTWFVGHNDRTGETGAFPIECVEDSRIDEPLHDTVISEKPARTLIYANVSETSKKRKGLLDWSPMERSKTLSNKAHKFDQQRLVGTKPEIAYRLKFVKTEDTETKDEESGAGGPDQENGEKDTSNDDHRTVSPPDIFSKTPTLQRVFFSVAEGEDMENQKNNSAEVAEGQMNGRSSDGKYHKFGRSKVLEILKSGNDENKRVKAVFGVVAGVVIGGLLFVVLVFSFDYTELEAGIIVALSTVIMSLCLAFSTLCRCIMALVFPNFFTGIGRTVFLSIIFGVLLTSPVANITNNAKETGNSLSCMTELVRNQTLALQRQLAEPFEELYDYIEVQNRRLKVLSGGICGPFSTGSSQINRSINETQGILKTVIQKCKAPMQELYNKCDNMCSLVLIGSECRKKCQEFTSLSSTCNQLNTLGTDYNKVANDVKAKFEELKEYFCVDVELHAEITGGSNTTKSVQAIQQEVNNDVTLKARVFEIFIACLKKALSLSLALLFFQSFWYLRNYLAKDDYDNVYITSQFIEMDKTSDQPVLPLKKKERRVYVNPSSFKLNTLELAYCKIGLAQILLHFVLCFLLLMSDFALYYILNLVRKYGDVELHLEGQDHFKLSVNGKGPLALFYSVMIQGINLQSNFTANLEIGKCLPRPKEPSVSIIPVLIILYIIALCFVLLRGYGMRLRRKIAAFYYPEQEMARLHYLHKKIRHKRIGLLKLIRQLIKSSHKEATVKEKLRLSAWLAFNLPFIGRFFASKERLVCTSCEHTEHHFNIKLTKCGGSQDGVACDAVYCEECWAAINHSCPLCTSNEAVILRD